MAEFVPDDLLKDYITESDELVQQIEQDLLILEGSSDPEILNRIFRGMHTLKGTSSFFGFEKLVQLAHRAEDLLNQLRKGELTITRQLIDTFLKVNDQIRLMMDDIRVARSPEHDITEYLAQLDQCAAAAGASPVPAAPTTPPAPTADTVEKSASPAIEIAVGVEGESVQVETEPAQQTPTPVAQVESPVATATPAETAATPIADAATPATPTPAAPAAVPAPAQPAAQASTPNTAAAADTMRVEIRKLDYLVNLTGELVLERNRLLRLASDMTKTDGKDINLTEALNTSTARLSFITDELQNASLRTRMVPIDNVFRKLPRLVREVSHQVGKEIDVNISGQDTEIDKTMIEQLYDPLVHIMRNSIDHGIESAEVRDKLGKNATGLIEVDARQQGDQIIVTIKDDGRGIDPEKIRKKVVEKGLYSTEHAAVLTKREIFDALFLPGFSTAEKVSNISGRGVGMDVVRTNLRHMNGTVEIDSIINQGTTVTLRVPLTMAILPVLLVQVSDEVYAIPLRSVLETVRLDDDSVHTVEGGEVLMLRDSTVPLLRLAQMVGARTTADSNRAVILSINDTRVALAVEGLIGQESTVIKPLSSLLRDSRYVAGATITGDGRVRLVLDPATMIRSGSSAYAVQ